MELHLLIVKGSFAVNALVTCKAPMSFNDSAAGDTRTSFERVDILGETRPEEAFVGEKLDERMRDCRPVLARVELLGKCIDWYKGCSSQYAGI